MRKNTDIQSVKDVLISFLHMPIEKTPVYPIVVQHPIFESGMVSVREPETEIGCAFVDITKEEGFNKAVNKIEKEIDSTDDLISLSLIVRRSYSLAFLKFIKPYLSMKDFSTLLSESWVKEESPNADANVSMSMAAEWFKQADKKVLMYKDEYKVFNDLPEEFVVYRGVVSGQRPDGMSWTRDLEKAKLFSNQFGEGYVRKGTVKKKNVLAYFNRREEDELVIEAKNVMNKETI